MGDGTILILTIFDEMFLKQGRDARRAAEAIGKAVGNDFCKFNTLLTIEPLQELYQLHDMPSKCNIGHIGNALFSQSLGQY